MKEFLNILELLKNNPNISTLIYTSQKVNEFVQKKVQYTRNTNRKFKINVDNKEYQVYILYSPSPNALRGMGENGKEKRLDQYTQVFKP